MIKETISIIIPIYKVNINYLNECLKSVCNQTYEEIEIIIVNDGMTVESLNLVAEYQKKDFRIKVIGKENEGVSCARNKGIDEATGDWIVFVDSDDIIDTKFCEKMLEIAKFKKSQCVVCGYNRLFLNRKEIIVKEKCFSINGNEFFDEIFNVQSGFGFVHMKLWKADLIKKEDIRFDKQLKVGEDALFCMQIAKKIKNVYYLNEALYTYRLNEQSAVRSFDEKYVQKYLLSMQKVKEYTKEINQKNTILLYNYIAYHILLIVINYCFHPENTQSGIKLLREVCQIVEFKEAINNSTYEGFSITRKITLFTLKHKLYFFTCIIAKIRQKQFRR